MQGVIMAGGFSTRMNPLTYNIPKPMLPLANIPIIEHVVRWLKKNLVDDIVMLLYLQPEVITEYFGDGSKWGVSLHYLRPEMDLGTMGAVKYAEPLLKDRFIVIGGEIVTDINLQETAVVHHNNTNAKITVLLTSTDNPLSQGIVTTDTDGRITKFLERPTRGQAANDVISTGIYIVEPEVLLMIPPDTHKDFTKDIFPEMMNNKDNLFGCTVEGYWKDIGNLDDYQEVHKDILQCKVKVVLPGKKRKNIWVEEGSKINDGAKFEGQVVIGKRCRIAPGANIINSTLGDGCIIEEGAYIANSILWDKVSVGIGSHIKEDIIAAGSKLEANVYLQERVFIGENCIVGENSRIQANVKVWPDKEIEKETTLSSSLIWGSRWEHVLLSEAKISGLVNKEMTPDFSARLGAAFGSFLGEGSRVLVSHDPSNGSRMINRSIIGGLLSTGVNVDNVQVSPVPVLRMGLRGAHYKGGLHVRQSPSDPRNIDVIFFDCDGHDLGPGKSKAVERLFFTEEYNRTSYDRIGKVDYSTRIFENYRNFFINEISYDSFKLRPLKVVVDYSWGGASSILPSILGALGCNVISLNSYFDPIKLSLTRQEIENSLVQLSKIVTTLRADAGFMINQTAESLIAVDEHGQTIRDQHLLSLVTELFLREEDVSKIGVPANATQAIDWMAEKYDVQVVRTMNSHRAMTEVSLRENLRFVGGTRGGFIFSDFCFACDAMFATAKILELLARANTTIGKVMNTIQFPYYISQSIPCSHEKKGAVMRHIYSETENMKRDLVDGVKVLYSNGWALITPDKSSGMFHIHAEAPKKSIAEKWVKEWKEKIKKWKKM